MLFPQLTHIYVFVCIIVGYTTSPFLLVSVLCSIRYHIRSTVIKTNVLKMATFPVGHEVTE